MASDRAQADGRVAQATSCIIMIKVHCCCAGGDVGEGEHFPAFRAGSGSGGGAAGRQSRSSTYPPALCFVHLPRRAIAMALMLALLVVENQPSLDAGFSLGDAAIGAQV